MIIFSITLTFPRKTLISSMAMLKIPKMNAKLMKKKSKKPAELIFSF